MKKEKIFFLICLFFVFIFSSSFQKFRDENNDIAYFSSDQQKIKFLSHEGLPYIPGEILVKFKTACSEQKIEALIDAYNSKKIKRIPRIDVFELQVPKGSSVEEMVFVLGQNPDVEYVEPNYIARILITPNDTLFKYQYALYNSGQKIAPVTIPGVPSGKQRADIKATAAWEETKGEEDVVIAIVDSGVDLRHPDIENKMQSSGRDFANDDFDATDDNGHGTHVAGIAAAETNNSEGVAGVAWNCKILPIKVMDKEGSGEYTWVAQGIVWAADNGVSVINLSIGGPSPSQTLLNALKYAYEKDVVIISATGNEGSSVLYPAAYDNYCLAVAATDYNDERVTFSKTEETWESNFGPEVDVAAPGDWIVSLWPTSLTPTGFAPYLWASGTSMATAHVTGLAALIKSIKPWLKPKEVMDVIRFSADDTNSSQYPGKDEFIGYGRINMEKALVPIKIQK